MKSNVRFLQICLLGLVSSTLLNCDKNEDNQELIIREYPEIIWENPASIEYGTLLSSEQLNATIDAPGTLVYTPEIGTLLMEGQNQELEVNFTPSDLKLYHTANKTVYIEVTLKLNPNIDYGMLTDQEGNHYKTIEIGNQTWMAQNLRTSIYRNGDSIGTIGNPYQDFTDFIDPKSMSFS